MTRVWQRLRNHFLVGLWTDRQGASAAEYALLLAIFAAGVAMAVIFLSTAITAAVQTPQM